MAVDERRRAELFEQFQGVAGREAADTLFELLPPPGRHVATTEDVDRLAGDLRSEMAALRAELRGEMGELRGEMAGLRGEMGELRGEMGELRGEMGELRGGIQGELQAMNERIDGLRHELLGALHQEVSRALVVQTRTTVFSMVTALAAISALALGLG